MYIVRNPLKDTISTLGNSYGSAHKCLQRTLRRLARDHTYKLLYDQFMKEYEDLNHMREIPENKLVNNQHYYLPHHGVIREQSTTTKLRVVFNGSSKTTSGKSINDIMLPGPNLLLNIVDVLTWIRQYPYLFSTDITKMFRQIEVHEDDWDLQRILWVDSQNNEHHYHLTTITYGTRAAPYLAVRTLLQLVQDEGHNYPLAVPSLVHGRYVDDIFGGGDTPNELEEKAYQLKALCKAGGFPLAKWHSSLPHITQETTDHI
ncbi:uncharacterized protein LOC122856397 [Aphidius gifuensis]|uniref:uncharacterized protein LOC122856397 n=1 Tax=Aphidius gifuensis TaxID=684658 RepID=UPI001CDC03D1|nr:uncharacterized protein LOC122856397 [Aphidius gifuensis]